MQYANTYKSYFYDLVQDSLAQLGAGYELHSFYYGESRRIEEAMRSDIAYPCMWLELPDYTYYDRGDNIVKETIGAFLILAGKPVEEYADQDDQLDQSQQIAEKVIKRMKQDGYLFQGDTITLEFITTSLTDNCYGCRVSFKLKYQETDFLC